MAPLVVYRRESSLITVYLQQLRAESNVFAILNLIHYAIFPFSTPTREGIAIWVPAGVVYLCPRRRSIFHASSNIIDSERCSHYDEITFE